MLEKETEGGSYGIQYFGFLLFLYFFFISGAFAEDRPQVEFFSPQGTVRTVRQVSARFSEQIVPLGDPRGIVEPFDIVCSEKGSSRWADGKNWAFDFEMALIQEEDFTE